jgi:hypothetical protein
MHGSPVTKGADDRAAGLDTAMVADIHKAAVVAFSPLHRLGTRDKLVAPWASRSDPAKRRAAACVLCRG